MMENKLVTTCFGLSSGHHQVTTLLQGYVQYAICICTLMMRSSIYILRIVHTLKAK